MRKFVLLILIVLCISAVVLTVLTYPRYQREMGAARERLLTGSQVIETASGPIEYATVGDGPPVLVVHGAGGGYDQGLILARVLIGVGFRHIAPSRFGFLRTPLPTDASPAAQADAFAELLDALNIEKVAVVGISAGGPSSLQFALRHPDRCSALVMVSAISHSDQPMDFMENIVHHVIFRSDFIFWVITENFQSNLISFFGVSPEIQAKLTPDEKHWLSDVVIPAMHPISQRQAGMLNDRTQSRDYPLDQITVPTLVIHAEDDSLVSISHGQYTAQNIPGAKLITLQSGGHILMGRHEKVRLEVVEFLKQHTQARAKK